GTASAGRSPGPREAVQARLAAVALQLGRVGRLGGEGDRDGHAVLPRVELHAGVALAELVLDQLLRHDLGVGAGEVEAVAAVLGLHARGELAPGAQVDGGAGGVPVVGRGVPLLDGFGVGVGAPYL